MVAPGARAMADIKHAPGISRQHRARDIQHGVGSSRNQRRTEP
jgi:hypothetical protein